MAKVRVCSSLIYPLEYDYASKSMPDVTHTVIASSLFNDTICTCPGWHNRGYCSHQQQVDDHTCTWVGGPASEWETPADEMTCPECGHAVEDYELDPEYA